MIGRPPSLRLLFALALLGAALPACGGGGGGGSTPPSSTPAPGGSGHETATPKPTSTPAGATPTPAVTPTPDTSPAPGSSFVYAGTLTQSFVRPPLTVSPLPSPNPASSSSSTASVAQTVSVLTPAAGACSGASLSPQYDFRASETDTFAQSTQTSKADQYVAYVASGASTQVYDVCSQTTASSGVTTSLVYGTGNGLVDVLPEAVGPIVPANNAALTLTQSDPDGQTDVRTVAAGGTYTQTTGYTATDPTTGLALTALAAENADGSGSYAFPLDGFSGTVVSVGAAPAAGVTTISIVLSYASELISGFGLPPSTGFAPAVWYAQPLVLASESSVDNGPAALPASCGVPAALAKSANQLVQTVAGVDTIFGETETFKRTSYTVTGIGVLCTTLSDTVVEYYDYSGQSNSGVVIGGGPFPLPVFSGTPVQTSTLTETLGLQSVTAAAAAERRAQAIGIRVTAAPSTAAFRALAERSRIARHRLRLLSAARRMTL